MQRLNRIQTELTLLFSDAGSAKAHAVLTEKDPYWVNVGNDLRFLGKRNQFLWSSERSGYRQLYLYTLDGKQKKQLTSGDYETSLAGVDEDRGIVYYLTRERSPLGQVFAAVDLESGKHRLLTDEPGSRTIDMSPAAKYYTEGFSSLKQPYRRTLRRISGEPVAVLLDAGKAADAYQYSVPEIVSVKADGDNDVRETDPSRSVRGGEEVSCAGFCLWRPRRSAGLRLLPGPDLGAGDGAARIRHLGTR